MNYFRLVLQKKIKCQVKKFLFTQLCTEAVVFFENKKLNAKYYVGGGNLSSHLQHTVFVVFLKVYIMIRLTAFSF